jgi:hypothetical protein
MMGEQAAANSTLNPGCLLGRARKKGWAPVGLAGEMRHAKDKRLDPPGKDAASWC